jgi:DNA-binding transcriptional ArsR family regulator
VKEIMERKFSQEELKEIFKELLFNIPTSLANPFRLKIMALLSQSSKPLSFSEIAARLNIQSPSLSYHLRFLEKEGFVINERRLDISTGKARTSFYWINKEKIDKLFAEIMTKYLGK